jgi:hypothetical protein
MYGNGKSITLGDAPPISIRGAYKRSFEGRKAVGDAYAYLEAHSGEYDAKERELIDDPYADGWAWFSSGKPLSKHVPSRFLSAKNKAEHIRLFEMGYKDAGELTK